MSKYMSARHRVTLCFMTSRFEIISDGCLSFLGESSAQNIWVLCLHAQNNGLTNRPLYGSLEFLSG